MNIRTAALGLLLAGCAPVVQSPARTAHLNVNGPPPDVVIFAVSGRCGPPCEAPRDNWDYLATRGTVDALADAIAAQGYRVQVATYADNPLETFESRKVGVEQRGYMTLLRDFNAMKAAWFGRPGAPRLVLLGHSHGSVWLHQLARVNQYIPFALQIDLDGNCGSWRLDNARNVALAQLDRPGEPPVLDACNRFKAGGQWVEAKDIVWPNVQRNLEVQSKRLPAQDIRSGGAYVNYLFDLFSNLRPDGSKAGIDTFLSTREDHSSVSYPQSQALGWVLDKTTAIATNWRVADGRLPLRGP